MTADTAVTVVAAVVVAVTLAVVFATAAAAVVAAAAAAAAVPSPARLTTRNTMSPALLNSSRSESHAYPYIFSRSSFATACDGL